MSEMKTYEELCDMSKNALLSLCYDLNIGEEAEGAGYDEMIDMILDRQEEMEHESSEVPATSVMANIAVNLVNPDAEPGNRTTAHIQVSCGGCSDMYNVVGKTAGSVMVLLTDVLNIPTNPKIIVNGSTEDTSYVLKEGDVLEFLKETGSKGIRFIIIC